MSTPTSPGLFLPGAPLGHLHRASLGHRVAAVVLHGFTSGPASVKSWAESLRTCGVDVVVPLLPGHGTRWEDLAAVTAEQWRSHVQEVVDEELYGANPADQVFIAGLSMGGALALDCAAHRPVAGVFLVNPALTFTASARWGALVSGALKYVVPSVGPIADDIACPGVVEDAYPRTPVAGVYQLRRLFMATQRVLSKITAPVTIYRSAVDNVVPDSSMRVLLKQLLDNTVTTVVPLSRSRHVATLDYDAEVIHEHSIKTITTLAQDFQERV